MPVPSSNPDHVHLICVVLCSEHWRKLILQLGVGLLFQNNIPSQGIRDLVLMSSLRKTKGAHVIDA